MKKIYISGKITGLDYGYALLTFCDAEEKCIEQGFEVINPMRLNHQHDKRWESYMRVDLKALLDCTHIFMLKDWHTSRGANIEYNLARELGIEIVFE